MSELSVKGGPESRVMAFLKFLTVFTKILSSLGEELTRFSSASGFPFRPDPLNGGGAQTGAPLCVLGKALAGKAWRSVYRSKDAQMVDVWIGDCNCLANRKSHFFSLLSPGERIRADRYLHPLKKERFVLSRGMLRSILSKYLDILPENIRFAYGEHGKPELKDIHKSFNFNVSHSRNIVVLAVTGCSRVGIDVEVMDRAPERLDRVIDFLCSPEEKDAYFAMPRRERTLSAYYLWTANEAYLKGVGSGVERFENKVTCYLETDGEPRINLRKGEQDSLWRFRNFYPLQDSVATLAIEACEPAFDVNFLSLD